MLKIAVLVSGGGSNLQTIIDKIADGYLNCEIVKVIASRSNIYALERAKNHGIASEIISPKKFKSIEGFTKAMVLAVKESGAELIITAGYLTILGEEFAQAFKNRIINVHPSLIPDFCGKGFYGLKVHEEVLKAGVKTTGATVHFVDEGIDTGAIIMQKSVVVMDDDTPETLQKRVMDEAESVILPKVIKLFEENKI
ncbi:MAG: phosphoribosylglycinamide formyltransferase [Defluviitaleaceae bacterium]|nr:phosphoribosylglycinamide formyltransferase [Defluviitaleaceae bacterium]